MASPSAVRNETTSRGVHVEVVNRVIVRVAQSESHESKLTGDAGGPLQASELADLSLLCSQGVFEAVEVDQLLTLVDLLARHVTNAVAVNFVAEAVEQIKGESPSIASGNLDQWLQGQGAERMRRLALGLEAAGILVRISLTPGIDRRVINEDALEGCISLMRHHLKNHLLPALNQSVSGESPKKKRKSIEGPGWDHVKIYNCVSKPTLHLQLILMERLDGLLHAVPMDDQQILMLSTGVMAALEIDCSFSTSGHQLQVSMVALLTSIFRLYPKNRETVLEDLFPILLRMPVGKKAIRSYPVRLSSGPSTLQSLVNAATGDLLPGRSDGCMSTISRLLLSLVQACVTRPGYSENQEWESGTNSCAAISDLWADQLVTRCATKGDSATDFRPHFVCFVEDMLYCLLIPEFPATETLLMSLVRRLSHDVGQTSSKMRHRSAKAPSFDTSYVNAAFDSLGKICAVQARILLLTKERPLRVKAYERLQGGYNLACYCGSSGKELLVGCNQCKTFMHGRCAGILDVSAISQDWICDPCRLDRILEREKTNFEQSTIVDESYALKHAFQAAIAHRLGVAGLDDAIHLNLATWTSSLVGTHKEKAKSIVINLLQYWDSPGPAGENMTAEGEARTILAMTAKTSLLLKSFRNQIMFILRMMADESSHTSRKLSLKAVEMVVSGDPSQMLLPVFTKALASRLTDDSISVREAALSLAGSYVVRSPEVANAFHASIISRLSDPGVSVRKRAVKIFESILTSNPCYKNRSSAFDKMLERAMDPKEEDGVRDLVERLFEHLWINSVSPSLNKFSLSTPELTSPGASSPLVPARAIFMDGNTCVTPTPPEQFEKQRQSPIDIAAMQMVEVVRAAGTTMHLEGLLKKFVKGKGKKLDNYNQSIVTALFEILLSVPETGQNNGSSVGSTMAATLQTIAVFSELAPDAVYLNIDTLLSYLKADNGISREEETDVVAAVCEIIYRLPAGNLDKLASYLATTPTADDLMNITYRFGPTASSAAVRAFLALAVSRENPFAQRLLKIVRSFYSFLYKRNTITDFSRADPKTRSGSHRALTVLGFVCQFHQRSGDNTSWDEELENDSAPIEPAAVLWNNYVQACYRIFSSYLRKDDSGTKCTALKGLGGIFVTQPRLLLQLDQEGLVEELMSDEAGSKLQIESLQCWCMILKAEELRIDGGQAKAKMDANSNITLSKKISGDQDGDATLFGGVLTNHSERLFVLSRSQDKAVRLAVLDIMALLLRQGLVNPNEAVPHLFAMQGDVDNDDIRSTALHLLSLEGVKRPDILRRRICAGVKRAYAFQKSIAGDEMAVSAIISRGRSTSFQCIFSRVFKDCISKNRKQRHGFFKNLLSLFKKTDGSKAKSITSEIDLLAFVAQILAHLQYDTIDDPLFIVHEVSALLALQGEETLDKMANTLRPVGLASADKCDDDITSKDSLENASMSKQPGTTADGKQLMSKQFDIDEFIALCTEGAALSLLLRLKTFICAAYNLTDIRCLEYSPTTSDRNLEKGIPRCTINKPFDIDIASLKDSKTSNVDYDEVIRQYAKFRQLMRHEYSTQAAATKDDDMQMEAGTSQPTSGQKRKLEEV